MRQILFVILAFSCLDIFATGTIRGKVIDDDTGEELIGASVLISGTTTGTMTDLDGSFSLEVEPGTYDVECSYISYEKKVITGVEVKDGEVTIINFRLGQKALDIKEVVVQAKKVRNTESALLTIQKKAPVILDGISSSQISKNGDSDAASAIKRVTGVSVEGGKYVYVRGLGDRYSKTSLNGAEIPGLDPNRNTVQMDLFPTNLINNIVVYKTFSPDLPASFTGGYVNIETKDFPEQFTLQFSNSFGFNTQSTFNSDFLTYEGGKLDGLAIDDGTRDAPDIDGEVPFYSEAQFDEDKADRLTEITRSFDDNLEFKRKPQFLNHNHSFSIGNQNKVFGKPLGYILGITYNRSFNYYDDGEIGRYSLTEREDIARTLNKELFLKDEQGQEEVLWGAMFNTNYKISNNHKIGINLLRNQSGEKTARYQVGRKPSDDLALRYQTRSWQFRERSLSSFQLKGEHNAVNLGNTKVDWITSYTISTQEEPDLRFFTNGYRVFGDDTVYRIEPSIGQLPTRYYRDMQEDNFDNKLNVTVPFEQWSGLKAKVKFGASYVYKMREFREQQYRYDNQSNTFDGNPDNYISDDNAWVFEEQDGVYIKDAFNKRNNYDATESTIGAYAMVDLPLRENLRVITGMRMEKTEIELESFEEEVPKGTLDDLDFLPAFNLNYNVKENMNIRFSYSRTLARPTFRELAPYASFDFIGDFVLIGSDSLKRTLIDNVDLRWEWFPGYEEIFSVSVFYKNFQNPIERAFNPVAANDELNYRNVENAWLVGGEVEMRKNLEFITGALKDLSIGANFTYVYSRVDISKDELESIRALAPSSDDYRVMFGQSPYLINGYISYGNEKGTDASLSFNMAGPRLAYIIVGGTPNIFEQPRPSLNFNFKQKLGKSFILKASAKNLLNPEYKLTYEFKGEEYIYETYKKGITFSLGVTYQIQ